MEIGYALIAEEHTAQDLVDHAAAAEAAGLEYLSVSDHFHPWLDEQGQSPFAWTVLGALADRTDLPLMTAVTAPILRYHPAIVAQAAATVATMTDDFVLGLGTGEALNEHVVGAHWPNPQQRQDMLAEAVGIIRDLFTGEEISHRGEFYTVDRARLYSRPAQPPPVAVAAGGERSARFAGECADALITTSTDDEVLDAFRDTAGDTAPVLGQITCCWAPSTEEANRIVRDRWRHAFLSWDGKADIPTPAGFASASQLVGEDLLGPGMPTGPELDGLADTMAEHADAGFDRVALHCVGPHQQEFLAIVGDRLDALR